MKANLNIKNKLGIIYEPVMAALAVVVLIVLIIEYTRPLTAAQEILLTRIDLTILTVFAADYFYRLFRAEKKWVFFKNNIFDLIAIIPFDKAFRLARLARLTRLTRLSRASRVSRLVRVVAITRKFTSNVGGILKTNGLQYILMFTVIMVLFGALGIYSLEPGIETFGDAVWWSLVTTTTVGYGDISPESGGGRIVAAVLMLVGIGMIGMITGSIATYFVNKLASDDLEPRKSVACEQLEYIKTKLDDLESLDEKDILILQRLIQNLWEDKNQESKVRNKSA